MKDQVGKVVREVLKEMGLIPQSIKGPRVLVVYHTGMKRLDVALEQVALIEAMAGKAAFWQGPEAREMMCPADLKDKTGARCSLNSVGDEGLGKVLDLAEVVILPTLSLKVAAGVVRLTVDCQGSELFLNALLKGKKVIVANDGFIAPGAGIGSGLRAEIERVLSALAGYGAILCPTAELARTYEALSIQGRSIVEAASSGLKAKPKTLITAKDITSASQAGETIIYLARGGLTTPLAKDLAKEYSIEIITEIE